MRKIFKYPLEINDSPQVINVNKNAKIVMVGNQDGTLCLWIEVDDQALKDPRKFYVKGTGHPIPSWMCYIGSAIIKPFVWHVYEEKVI